MSARFSPASAPHKPQLPIPSAHLLLKVCTSPFGLAIVNSNLQAVEIGGIVPDTGGDIYNTDDVAVSYPGGCLDNVQQFECVSERCLIEGFFEIRGKKTEDQYGFNWKGEGWEFSQNSEILGFCTKNDDEGCTKTGVNYSPGFFSHVLCTGYINSGF
ncbi:hypothetical protein FCOIX_4732 [Fusarium coicis]|nr:hypothetical protein FCOIX_4732 [Fusarium coicis]